ncbi:MAG TPA: undecaprenyldiphospho-muramoylpentapeptide beta-N-acetylglucosaminyltransferase, partial [Rhizobiales bacterium]|nr:undecaprenyldiphospho-muramoylpentapeptide beta-N-acetylglucosaminyltransferase [Hyphomicrobiales bacterium]
HLFPALALARVLRARGQQVILFSDERARGYDHDMPVDEVFIIPAASVSGRSPLKILSALFTLVRGAIRAWRLMGELRPCAMVGFGGYPTLPPLYGARFRGIPVLVHEANAVMGRANRLAAGFARAVAGSFERMKYLPSRAKTNYVLTGMPVRDAVLEQRERSYHAPEIHEPFCLLVFGGSQGARAFSDIIPEAIKALDGAEKERLRIVQQCRPEDLERVRKVYEEAGVEAVLDSFFTDMPEQIATAHLVISRAGASTVSEIACIGRPAILVPFPHSIDQDQRTNARELEKTGGGWVWEEKNLTPEALAHRLTELMNSPRALEEAAARARTTAKPDAAERLADLVETYALRGEDTDEDAA